MYVPPIRMVQFGSPPIRMVPPGVAFLHLAEQFVFIVLAFHEYYKEKCMSHSATQGNCLGLISYYLLKEPNSVCASNQNGSSWDSPEGCLLWDSPLLWGVLHVVASKAQRDTGSIKGAKKCMYVPPIIMVHCGTLLSLGVGCASIKGGGGGGGGGEFECLCCGSRCPVEQFVFIP